MTTTDILSLLIAERDKLSRAIEALEGRRRRGRPPKAISGRSEGPTPFRTGRRRKGMSAAARKQQSQRMKAYWAARRKA